MNISIGNPLTPFFARKVFGEPVDFHFSSLSSLEDLAVETQIATSKSDAKRRNLSGEIERGYSEVKSGHNRIFIFNNDYSLTQELLFWFKHFIEITLWKNKTPTLN